MVEAVMLWNEPNNLSHWDFKIDPDWKIFAAMVVEAARAIRQVNPGLRIALGGISPIDPNFLNLLDSYGVIDAVDVVSVHGFPLDWNHWNIHEWPKKIEEIRAAAGGKTVWVSEAGASSFGAEEVQSFGLQKTAELLLPQVERVHWYSLFDLPSTWTATTRHKEAEGSAYYRHYYMGLIREDGTAKPAAAEFPREMGICQWFHYDDHRLDTRRGVAAQAGRALPADRDQLGRLVSRKLRALVRPPDARPLGVRDDHDPVLHTGAPGARPALHQSAEGCLRFRGVRDLGGRALCTRQRTLGSRISK